MTANEIRKLNIDELSKKEKELKQELFNLKFQHSLSKTLGANNENGIKIKKMKKDIARIKTIITEKKNES